MMDRPTPRLRCLALALMGFGLMAQTPTLPIATPLRAYARGYQEPVRLATDGAGRLYIVDSLRNTIFVRDEAGKLLGLRRGFARPLGIAVDAAGRILVCEADKGRVAVFTSSWEPAGYLGQGDGEFQMPNHLLVAPDGLVYVVDSRANLVKVFGTDGVLVRSFGGYGTLTGQFDFPTGIALTPAGELLVADQGNERIQVFDTAGTFVRSFGKKNMTGTNTTFGRIQGMLADAQGRVYLADSFRGFVNVVTPMGTSLGSIGSYGTDAGQLMGPSALALDRNNRLFVAAPGNTRIEVYGLDTFADFSIVDATLKLDTTTLVRSQGLNHRHRGWDGDEDVAVPVRNTLLTVLIKLPGISPTSIVESSITANNIPALRMRGAYIADFDQDGHLEYKATFNVQRLLSTMGNGSALLVVSGRLTDGRAFESLAEVTVVKPAGEEP